MAKCKRFKCVPSNIGATSKKCPAGQVQRCAEFGNGEVPLDMTP